MRVLVTVGATTEFDSLVGAVLEENSLEALRQKGYTILSVQIGSSPRYQEFRKEQNGITIDTWRFKPSLHEDIKKADLVISHAGSGTILDVLRLHKPLIVVPNSTLLHNHQLELAEALDAQGYLAASTPSDLSTTIARFDPAGLSTFPAFDAGRFSSVLDGVMGFK